MNHPIANGFSKAIIQLAVEQNNVASVRRAAEEMLPLLQAPEIVSFLHHPSITPADKKVVLAKLIPTDAPQSFINLVNLVADRHYAVYLADIMEKISEFAIKAQGYEIVTIVTAGEVDEVTEASIRKDLETKWSTRIFLKKRQNPNIIGGMIIQMEDRLYDGSLLGQIKNLRRILTDSSV